jgi:hypothetical protein
MRPAQMVSENRSINSHSSTQHYRDFDAVEGKSSEGKRRRRFRRTRSGGGDDLRREEVGPAPHDIQFDVLFF